MGLVPNLQSRCWKCRGLELVAWRSHPFPHQVALVPAWADSLGSENSFPLSQDPPVGHVLPSTLQEALGSCSWWGGHAERLRPKAPSRLPTSQSAMGLLGKILEKGSIQHRTV